MAWSLGREVVTGGPAASNTAIVVTLGAQAPNVPIGNLLVLAMVAPGTHLASSVVTNSTGLSDIVVLHSSDASGGSSTTTIVAARVTGALSSGDTITVTFASACTPTYHVTDYSNPAGAVQSFVADKTSAGTAFGSASFSSGTTAALAGADDLLVGNIGFDDGTGTNTITPTVLSPAWAATTTAVQTGTGSQRHSMRWRSPGSTTGAVFGGTISTTSDYCAQVVAIKATFPAAAGGVAPTRIANPRVGPMALRHNYRFRRPPIGTSIVTTPVSSTLDVPFEALQGIAQSGSDPLDAAQGLATTQTDPLEAIQGIASSASDPIEETGGVAATAADPVEALAGVAAPLVDPFESIQGGIASTSLVPFESLQGIVQALIDAIEATGGIASTGVDPLEALRGIAAPQSDPIESSTGLATTSADPFEANQGIATTILVPFEATGGIATSAIDPLEALGAVAAALSDPYEAQGSAVTPVSATSQAPFEAIQGIARALGLPLEALGGIASTGTDPIEAVAALAVTSPGPFESLGSVARTLVAPIEATGGIAQVAVVPLESLQAIISPRSDPFEVVVLLGVGTIGAFDSPNTQPQPARGDDRSGVFDEPDPDADVMPAVLVVSIFDPANPRRAQ